MSEQEIIVGPGSVSIREIPPSKDHSDAEVTASGRELDALVAEHVMGYRWAQVCGVRVLLSGDWDVEIHEDCIKSRGETPYALDHVDHFSDWDSVFDVIDRMADHGYWCEMRSPFSMDGGARWWAGFTPHLTSGWNGRPDHWHSGRILPEAVCRAAVAAMLAQKDDQA